MPAIKDEGVFEVNTGQIDFLSRRDLDSRQNYIKSQLAGKGEVMQASNPTHQTVGIGTNTNNPSATKSRSVELGMKLTSQAAETNNKRATIRNSVVAVCQYWAMSAL